MALTFDRIPLHGTPMIIPRVGRSFIDYTVVNTIVPARRRAGTIVRRRVRHSIVRRAARRMARSGAPPRRNDRTPHPPESHYRGSMQRDSIESEGHYRGSMQRDSIESEGHYRGSMQRNSIEVAYFLASKRGFDGQKHPFNGTKKCD
jgi:hypothetical protein